MRNVMRLAMWVLVILLASWSPVAEAADCPVQIRLWVDGGDAWFDYGETVVVPTTEPRPRLGVYVKTGRHPMATTAEWSYPKDFGFSSARPAEVAEHLRFTAQSRQDIESGRLRFTTVAAGETYLGYRISAVSEPGDLEDLPATCISGEVRIEIAEPVEEAPEMAPEELATTLCQEAVREKLTSLSGATIEFSGGETETISDTEARVTVDGELIANASRRPIKYGCLVDLEISEVTELQFLAPSATP